MHGYLENSNGNRSMPVKGMLKILHTADWHLGQRLHGHSREYEHRCFLDWLAECLYSRQCDALLVVGDIFDSTNPPAQAQQMFHDFIRRVHLQMPHLQMIFLAGNHDSPARLEAIRPLLSMFNTHAIGAISIHDDRLDTEPLLIPIKNAQAQTEAVCAAMPYLRPVDIPLSPVTQDHDPLVAGVRQRYAELQTAARKHRKANQAVLVTGHCYMARTQLSQLSERRILGGNQHALPIDIFCDEIDYVALGHLHLAQSLRPHIHYSGSPLPLSLAEADYPHQVLEVCFEHGRLQQVTPIRVPRAVEIIRLPKSRSAAISELEHLLATYEWNTQLSPEQYPWLELRVRLAQPKPGLWEHFRQMLEGKPVRFLKLSVETPQKKTASIERHAGDLEQLDPERVFRLCHEQRYAAPPTQTLIDCFHALWQDIEEYER